MKYRRLGGQRIASRAHEIGWSLDEVCIAITEDRTGAEQDREIDAAVLEPCLELGALAPRTASWTSGYCSARAVVQVVTSGCAVEGRLPILTLPIGVPAGADVVDELLGAGQPAHAGRDALPQFCQHHAPWCAGTGAAHSAPARRCGG